MPPPRPMPKFAACKFCGQFQDFTGITIAWDADIIEVATRHCNCKQAKEYVERISAAEKAKQNRDYALYMAREAIEEILGESAIGNGRLPVREETKQLIMDVATLVYDRKLKGGVINITSCVKVKIAKTGKDKLVFKRDDSATLTQEVDGE